MLHPIMHRPLRDQRLSEKEKKNTDNALTGAAAIQGVVLVVLALMDHALCVERTKECGGLSLSL